MDINGNNRNGNRGGRCPSMHPTLPEVRVSVFKGRGLGGLHKWVIEEIFINPNPVTPYYKVDPSEMKPFAHVRIEMTFNEFLRDDEIVITCPEIGCFRGRCQNPRELDRLSSAGLKLISGWKSPNGVSVSRWLYHISVNHLRPSGEDREVETYETKLTAFREEIKGVMAKPKKISVFVNP